MSNTEVPVDVSFGACQRIEESGARAHVVHSYPSEEGQPHRIAVCVCQGEREYQRCIYAYDDPERGGSRTSRATATGPMVCSLTERGTGFATSVLESEKGKPHRKLVMTRSGGLLTGTDGEVKDRDGKMTDLEWKWDRKRARPGTPPSHPVVIPLNPFLRLTYVSRDRIELRFQANGVSHTLIGGIQTKESVMGSPNSGTKSSRSSRRLPSTARSQSGRQLDALTDLCASMDQSMKQLRERLEPGGRGTKPYIEPGWKDASLAQTMREVPQFERMTPRTAAERLHGHTGESNELGATRGSSRISTAGAAVASSLDAEATTRGASWAGDRWLSELETRKRLSEKHPPLPQSAVMRHVSGRYLGPAAAGFRPSRQAEETFARLTRCPAGEAFDAFVKSKVLPDQLLLVACLRNDESHCRRTAQLLERVNGTLRKLYPWSSVFTTGSVLESDAAARDKRAAQAAEAGVQGVGPGGRETPYVLARYDMERDAGEWLRQHYNIWTLPFFLCFVGGRLVYRGVMGGSSVVKLPACNRPPNMLLVETDTRRQLRVEQLLHRKRIPFMTATGRFNSASGCMEGVGSEALQRVRELAVRRKDGVSKGIADFVSYAFALLGANILQGSSREAVQRARRGKSAEAGTDATAQMPGDFAIVLLDATAPGSEWKPLLATLRRRGRVPPPASPAGVSEGHPTATAGLEGRTLVVACHPLGSVIPSSEALSHIPRVTGILPKASDDGASSFAQSVPADAWELPEADDTLPWACPHTGLIRNPTAEHLMKGVASVAVVHPLKPATVDALAGLWRRCIHSIGESTSTVAGTGGKRKAHQRPGEDPGTFGDGDGVHLGLTHNDMLRRLDEAREAGLAGRTLGGIGSSRDAAVLVSASETTVRGIHLRGDDEEALRLRQQHGPRRWAAPGRLVRTMGL